MRPLTASQRVAVDVVVSALMARSDVKSITADPALWRYAIALATVNSKAPTKDIIDAARSMAGG
jgi:hypothetical protein